MLLRRFCTSAVFALVFAGCSGSAMSPAPGSATYAAGRRFVGLTTIDRTSGGPCAVSLDGFVYYTLPAGLISPIDFSSVDCTRTTVLDGSATPALPQWSHSTSGTQAIFVATSLQETYSPVGMQRIETDAEKAAVPVTWMVGTYDYLDSQSAFYNASHASNGDDVELEDDAGLYADARMRLPWFAPAVSVEGAGHERNIAGALALGNTAFWGITWNSHGTDSTTDVGAPWGTFCADETSYKRPAPGAACPLVSFEWSARDLTRAYLTDTNADGYSAEAAFSTDPDDVLIRGDFTTDGGAAYVRSLVDAYASAGVTQPIVMMSQQESVDEALYEPQDDVVLSALYDQAVHDGMKPMTLRSAAAAAPAFSANPRAIAFPFIPGGRTTAYDGVPFAPATIDFHDAIAGMTFLSGHTLPSRLFEYSQDPVSTFDHALVQTSPSSAAYPHLDGVTASNGSLAFTFTAPSAIHFGIAIWSDPAVLGPFGSNVTPAGHAGFVATFDLPPGRSTQTVTCDGCTSTTFTYAS